jgi:hypothetical protein
MCTTFGLNSASNRDGWTWPHTMCSVLLCKECIIFFMLSFCFSLGTVHWPCIAWQRSYNHSPFCLLKWSLPIQISSLCIRICHEPGFIKKVSLNFPLFYQYKSINTMKLLYGFLLGIATSWYRFVVFTQVSFSGVLLYQFWPGSQLLQWWGIFMHLFWFLLAMPCDVWHGCFHSHLPISNS